MADPWDDETLHDDGNFELLAKEKRAKARARQAKTDAAALRKSELGSARAVGNKIRACTEGDRCGSGACIQCSTATRRGLMRELKTQYDVSLNFLTATIVPSPDPSSADDLGNFDATKFADELTERLADAGLGIISVTGAIDISLNAYSGLQSCRLWVPHWTLFFPDCDRQEVRSRLTRVFLRSQFVEKPVYVQEVTKTPLKSFSYAYKSVFYELAYLTTERGARWLPDKPVKIVPGHPSFDHLAFHLDRIGLAQRILRKS